MSIEQSNTNSSLGKFLTILPENNKIYTDSLQYGKWFSRKIYDTTNDNRRSKELKHVST